MCTVHCALTKVWELDLGWKTKPARTQQISTKKNRQKVTSLFVSRWSPTLVLEKALSCLTSLIGREAVEPGCMNVTAWRESIFYNCITVYWIYCFSELVVINVEETGASRRLKESARQPLHRLLEFSKLFCFGKNFKIFQWHHEKNLKW